MSVLQRGADLFCGWGGFTEAAEAAGCQVVYAANHWPLAVEVHSQNHPRTHHECQDLRQADFTLMPEYDFLLASAACQGHSNAGQPVRAKKGIVAKAHDELRATAWAVVECCTVTRPKALIVENVPQFADWELIGPWTAALEKLGYHVQLFQLVATDFGVPQLRKRCFVIGTLEKAVGRAKLEFPKARKLPSFRPCIEPGGPWRPIASCRGENARYRLERAARVHQGDCLVQHVTNHPGVPLSEPIRTITTKDQWCVVRGDQYRPLTLREYARGMSFRDTFSWPAMRRKFALQGIGNAVPPKMGTGVIRALRKALG